MNNFDENNEFVKRKIPPNGQNGVPRPQHAKERDGERVRTAEKRGRYDTAFRAQGVREYVAERKSAVVAVAVARRSVEMAQGKSAFVERL